MQGNYMIRVHYSVIRVSLNPEFLTLPFGLITYRTLGHFWATSGGFLIKPWMQHLGRCNKPHTVCTLTCVFPKSSLLGYEKISAPFLNSLISPWLSTSQEPKSSSSLASMSCPRPCASSNNKARLELGWQLGNKTLHQLGSWKIWQWNSIYSVSNLNRKEWS